MFLLVRRVEAFAQAHQGDAPPFIGLYTATFVWLLWTTLLAYAERPYRADASGQRALDAAYVAVLVPVYNEDAAWLRRSLVSLLAQTRLPDSVNVVDDGSNVAYDDVRDWFLKAAADVGVAATWKRTVNRGKRHAQVTAAADAPHADFFLTIDSDADLDRACVHEILQPFARSEVQSVAAVVLSANTRAGWLTRLFDFYSTTWQLNDRSAQSVIGSVVVNTGACAAYRAAVLRDHEHAYLNQTFMGRPVAFSDDSMLTLLAKLRGRTVQQPTAFALAAMPENLSHHLRQQIRWARGSAIRSCWRVWYLPLACYAFWYQVANWFMTLSMACLFVWLFLIQSFAVGTPLWTLIAIPALLSYLSGLRFLTIHRADEPLRRRLATFVCAPLAMLWGLTVLRAVKWYGAATCARSKWGTRTDVELQLRSPAEQPTATSAS